MSEKPNQQFGAGALIAMGLAGYIVGTVTAPKAAPVAPPQALVATSWSEGSATDFAADTSSIGNVEPGKDRTEAEAAQPPARVLEDYHRPVTTSRTVAAEPEPAAYYPNCSAARAAGVAPIRFGEPGYSGRLDRDGDGVACE